MKNFVRLILMMVISFMMAINVNGQTILCVDRDFDDSAGVFTDTWPMIQSALDAMGYTYDYWEVINFEDNGPDANYMGSYDAVIWFTGEAWTDGATMGPEDEFNLVLYMAFGGKLFMNAQDWLYDRYTSYGTFSEGEFPYDNLGIIEVVQDVVGVTGQIFLAVLVLGDDLLNGELLVAVGAAEPAGCVGPLFLTHAGFV